MSGTLSPLTDSEVLTSITNIYQWLQSPAHSKSILKLKKVSAEDLAIGIPGECLFLKLLSENEEASREDEKGILVFTDERDEKFVWLKEDWHHVEKILSIYSPKNGWQMTVNLWERLLLLILTQLDYSAKESEAEVPYGCCPLSDPAYLLWQNNRPVGMCSIKRKGSSIWGGEEVYACDSLDTLYIRVSHRRRGYALSLLAMLASQLSPSEHLGLSHPISLSMCRVLIKFIQVYPSLRDSLWTLDEDGEVCGTVLLMLGSLMLRGSLGNSGVDTSKASTVTTPTRAIDQPDTNTSATTGSSSHFGSTLPPTELANLNENQSKLHRPVTVSGDSPMS